jgi:hypothetical protein
LAKPEVLPILSEAICPVLLHDDCLMLCNMWGRFQMCGCSASEISPTFILVPILFKIEKNKKNKQGHSSQNTGEPKFLFEFFIYYL